MAHRHRIVGGFRKQGRLARIDSIDGGTVDIDANTIALSKLARVGSRGQSLISQGSSADPVYASNYGGELLDAQSVPAAANLEWTPGGGLVDPTVWDGFRIVLVNVRPDTDDVALRHQVYTNSTLRNSADYDWVNWRQRTQAAATPGGAAALGSDYIQLNASGSNGGVGVGTDAGEDAYAELMWLDANKAAGFQHVHFWMTYVTPQATPNLTHTDGTGFQNANAETINGFRFYWSAGSFETQGTAYLYGLKLGS